MHTNNFNLFNNNIIAGVYISWGNLFSSPCQGCFGSAVARCGVEVRQPACGCRVLWSAPRSRGWGRGGSSDCAYVCLAPPARRNRRTTSTSRGSRWSWHCRTRTARRPAEGSGRCCWQRKQWNQLLVFRTTSTGIAVEPRAKEYPGVFHSFYVASATLISVHRCDVTL